MLEGRARTKKRIGCASLSEDYEQVKTVVYLQKMGALFYSVPNGGMRNMKEAIKLKRTGVSSGVPDLVIPMPRKSYHGLYIELKRAKGGALSDNQRWWLAELNRNGYCAVVARGFDEAKKVIDEYFKVPSSPSAG